MSAAQRWQLASRHRLGRDGGEAVHQAGWFVGRSLLIIIVVQIPVGQPVPRSDPLKPGVSIELSQQLRPPVTVVDMIPMPTQPSSTARRQQQGMQELA